MFVKYRSPIHKFYTKKCTALSLYHKKLLKSNSRTQSSQFFWTKENPLAGVSLGLLLPLLLGDIVPCLLCPLLRGTVSVTARLGLFAPTCEAKRKYPAFVPCIVQGRVTLTKTGVPVKVLDKRFNACARRSRIGNIPVCRGPLAIAVSACNALGKPPNIAPTQVGKRLHHARRNVLASGVQCLFVKL